MDNLISLHNDLRHKTYTHSSYQAFNISDPKPRNIHKASVRDRVLHRAVYRVLYPYFDNKFIYDSYSCRIYKGIHRALNRFESFSRKVSKNNTKQCYVLKCDIKKFFASIDQEILLNILDKYIEDREVIWLLREIVYSFNSGKEEVGLPLGNLISQLLVNIYMNEFDQYMKHELKVKYYIRYADDFVILDQDRNYLLELIPKISIFLRDNLKLELHPNKVFIKTLSSGIDFLGWIHFPYHRVLRTATKRRMLKRLKERNCKKETLESYLGMLSHGNTHKLERQISFNLKTRF